MSNSLSIFFIFCSSVLAMKKNACCTFLKQFLFIVVCGVIVVPSFVVTVVIEACNCLDSVGSKLCPWASTSLSFVALRQGFSSKNLRDCCLICNFIQKLFWLACKNVAKFCDKHETISEKFKSQDRSFMYLFIYLTQKWRLIWSRCFKVWQSKSIRERYTFYIKAEVKRIFLLELMILLCFDLQFSRLPPR